MLKLECLSVEGLYFHHLSCGHQTSAILNFISPPFLICCISTTWLSQHMTHTFNKKKLDKGTQPLHLGLCDYVSLFGGLCVCSNFLGRVPLPNRMNFRKNSKRPSTPTPHFWKLMLQFFYDRYGCIYARRYDGQIVWNACTHMISRNRDHSERRGVGGTFSKIHPIW